jgi:hypothetical protein
MQVTLNQYGCCVLAYLQCVCNSKETNVFLNQSYQFKDIIWNY